MKCTIGTRSAAFIKLSATFHRTSLRAWIPDAIPKSERCVNAIGVLANPGCEARAAVPRLIELLDDELMAGSALAALSAIGRDAKQAVPRLVAMLEDSENPTPFVALTLASVGTNSPRITQALRRATSNGSTLLRLEAAQALKQLDATVTFVECPTIAFTNALRR